MVWYTYGTTVVVDPVSNDIVENATGGKFRLTIGGADQPMRDVNGTTITSITSNQWGQSSIFQAESLYGVVQFGAVAVTVWANEVADKLVQVDTAVASAAAAAASAASAVTTANAAQTAATALSSAPAILPAGGSSGDVLYRTTVDRVGVWAPPPSGGTGGTSDWATLANKPTTFPPSTHTHTAADVSDATTVGRALVTALDAQAARAAIGAGTGSGTSNLALGSTASTAAPGNHTHNAVSVSYVPTGTLTATNVQDAIAQAANTGGTSGASPILVWRYTAGGWPTLPVTKPSGVYEVRALGPSYPTSLPSWVGLSATQIPLSYSKVAVL